MDKAKLIDIGYAVFLGLVGAAVLHIVILLLLPELSDRNAWSRMANSADLYQPMKLEGRLPSAPQDANRDPLFESVACRFDLSEGLVRIDAAGTVPYWSASIYNRSGESTYSFNDRSASNKSLDFIVLTPTQMLEVRKEVPEDLQRSIFVESQSPEGIAVVRAFLPDESWKPAVEAFLESIKCRLQ